MAQTPSTSNSSRKTIAIGIFDQTIRGKGLLVIAKYQILFQIMNYTMKAVNKHNYTMWIDECYTCEQGDFICFEMC